MIELIDFLGIGAAPLVVGLVKATRIVFPCEDRWVPLLALGWSALLNAIIAYAVPVAWPQAVLATFLCSLTASGLYTQVKALAGR